MKNIMTTNFLAKYFSYLLIKVSGSAIYTNAMPQANYWPYNTNTEGLRENFNKLSFIGLFQNFREDFNKLYFIGLSKNFIYSYF